MNLRRILVPTDISSCSRKALQYAVALAKDYGASIVLMHVIEERAAADKERSNLDAALRKFARGEVHGKVPVTTLVESGVTLRAIENLARTSKVDLLVISTRARAGFPDFCLKSAAEEIVRDQERHFVRKRQPALDPATRRPQKRARARHF